MLAKGTRLILAAIGLSLIMPSLSSAQENDRRFYLTPGINYNFLDKAHDTDDDAGFQLSIGKPLSTHFDLELMASSWEAEDDDAEGEFNAIGLNLLYFYQRDDLSPYGLLGVMATDYDLTRNGVTTDESGAAFNVGAGLLQQIARHGTSLRWEYRYRHHGDTEDFDDHVLALGVQIPLGAAPEIVAPAPPPPPRQHISAPPKFVPPPSPKPELPEPTVVLQGVHFEHDSARLSSEAMTILSNMAVTLKNMSDTEVIAIGHTSNVGPEDYNDRLSLDRAKSVQDFLVNRGVEKARIKIRGYGESLPVADNSTEEGRRRNRRVEISVITDDLCLPARKGEAADDSGCAIIE